MFSISRIHQVLQLVPRGAFDRIVEEHQADKYTKKFGCWQQLLAMVYVQLSGTKSLRELEMGFNAHPNQHYHLGMGAVRRTTLSDANATRNPIVFAELLQLLIAQGGRSARKQRKELLYLLDATRVPLGEGAIKLHVLLNADTEAVAAASITPANVNDITEARKLDIEPAATYVFDKGYCHYNWWHEIHTTKSRWVTRFRRDARLNFLGERAVRGDIQRDSIVAFALRNPRGGCRNLYSAPLRRIEVCRPGKAPLVLATNDLRSSASRIAGLYKQRWQIELLFKWLKQHLQIRRFVGKNENAARIQLLTALIAYMLVLLLKTQSGFKDSLWMLLAQLRHSLFQRPQTEESYWRRRKRQQRYINSVQPSLL